MSGIVYVETTIFSFYHDARTSPEVVAMRGGTRQWRDRRGNRYDLVTSTAVLAELETGEFPHKPDALSLAQNLPAIPVGDELAEIVDVYIAHKVMPRDPVGDALHLAPASFHKCDYLLTWNCRHLANANKFNHIRRVNTLLGLSVPTLATPLELIGGEESP